MINSGSRDDHKNQLIGSSLKKFDTVNNSNLSKNRELNTLNSKKRGLHNRKVRKRSKNTLCEYNTIDIAENNTGSSTNQNSKTNLHTIDRVFMPNMNLYLGKKKLMGKSIERISERTPMEGKIDGRKIISGTSGVSLFNNYGINKGSGTS